MESVAFSSSILMGEREGEGEGTFSFTHCCVSHCNASHNALKSIENQQGWLFCSWSNKWFSWTELKCCLKSPLYTFLNFSPKGLVYPPPTSLGIKKFLLFNSFQQEYILFIKKPAIFLQRKAINAVSQTCPPSNQCLPQIICNYS